MNNFEQKENNLFNHILKEIGETPKDIFTWIRSNVSYDNNISDWKLRSSFETISDRKGNCHDQSYLITTLLYNINVYSGQLFFIEYNKNNPIGGNTHTLTWYKDNKQIYWMETAWENQAKIHGSYKTIEDLKNDVLSLYKKDSDINSNRYDGIAFSSLSNYQIGMSLGEYVESWEFGDNYILNK